jgi:hypothetical protein
MVSSRGMRVLAFVALGLGSGPARAAADAGADSERFAQKVASTVGSHHGEVKACYAVALERNRQLAGRFEAKWTIDTAGKPQSVHFETPPADTEFAACMVRTIAAWRFERATEPTEVTFPFVFGAAGATPQQPSAPAPPPAAESPAPSAPAKSGTAKRKRTPTGTTGVTGASDTRPAPKR